MEPTWSEALQQINALLTPAKEVAIILRPNPSADTLAAGFALEAALKKLGRRTVIICPDKIEQEGVLTDFPKKLLSVNLYYQAGGFENLEIQKTAAGLGLLFRPKPGEPLFEPQTVIYKEYALSPEICFLIEVENLVHLGEFYQKNQAFFGQVPLVNLDYHQSNSRFGKINLIDTKAVGVSEIVTLMLYDLRAPLDAEIAKGLYQGLANRTQNFSQNYFSANLLESASILLRYQKSDSRLPVKSGTP